MTGIVTVGVDPHRQVFTATVLDQRGRDVGHEHFENTRAGHAAVLTWARRLGAVGSRRGRGRQRPGPAPGRVSLSVEDIDVRDVPPHKTSLRATRSP